MNESQAIYLIQLMEILLQKLETISQQLETMNNGK